MENKGVIRDGHKKRVKQIEDKKSYLDVLEKYRDLMGCDPAVYLRPTDGGFTAISLNPSDKSMIGISNKAKQDHLLTKLDASIFGRIKNGVDGYREKSKDLKRTSSEEKLSLEIIRSSFKNKLSILGLESVCFVAQEWRIPKRQEYNGQQKEEEEEKYDIHKIDILGVNPKTRKLVVVELKDNEKSARKNDTKKGGNAWEQAKSYSNILFEYKDEIYEYMQTLIFAMAEAHDASDSMKNVILDIEEKPEFYVSWEFGKYYDSNSNQRII